MAMLKVRNLLLGTGAPKLVAPIMGSAEEDVLSQAAAITGLGAEVAEWRFDACKPALWAQDGGVCEQGSLWERMRINLLDLPLIFTYRTAAELSGETGCPDDYEPILSWALDSRNVDIIDIELNRGKKQASKLAAMAREAGVYALLSVHDYKQTPKAEAMSDTLLCMEDAGADIAKLAVMPQSPADVLAIFSAMEESKERLSIPFAIMGMGGLGAITRLSGGLFGAAFTFGSGVNESAPGQPKLESLRAAFEMIYKE